MKFFDCCMKKEKPRKVRFVRVFNNNGEVSVVKEIKADLNPALRLRDFALGPRAGL